MTEDTSVRFELQLEDHRAMTAHLCAPASSRSKAVSAAFGGLGSLLCILVASYFVESLQSFMLGFFAVAVLLFVAARLVSSGVRAQLKPTPGGTILCEYQVTISSDGVDIHTPHWDSVTRWSGLIAVDQTPEHIFLKLDSVAAYTIPKRAFHDESAFQQFTNQCRFYLARQTVAAE